MMPMLEDVLSDVIAAIPLVEGWIDKVPLRA